ncbi:protein-methionine-sulfoxide reductase catalytic subunit MsrP [Salinarimonas chemoclinalis]|uniref:protein-methionine-sulfoxide reductase catalytic subunit MsrP n=1 Tax=Salinarimonas chemoclinalis TaxID=3241599 RepID=UPI003557B652
MLIKRPRGWELPESAATPERVWLSRRSLMLGGAGLIGAATLPGLARAQAADPTADLYPAPRNESFVLDRPVTDESIAANYNNFYEFGSSKRVAAAAQALRTRPWTVVIDGLVEEERTLDFDDLIRTMTLEERLYRLRCVETWAMAVPWTGFPLADLVAMARPLSSARYLRFETFLDPEVARGQRQTWYSWPYVEGVTMAEATNELAFLVTGVYGKPLANQFGAPLRLALPWKYGFKSIKSIVRISFTAERPVSFWERQGPTEYGFWANVNPEVPHPRWSQARERMLGTDEEFPTQLFNGYGEWVAGLYAAMEDEPLFM